LHNTYTFHFFETPRKAAALFLNEGRRTARLGVRKPVWLSENESESVTEIAGDDTANDAMPFFRVAVKVGKNSK
jgi:hypothetical protein